MKTVPALALIAFGALPAAAGAADWPTKPVRLIVPLTAGGPTDILARIIGAPLGAALGQQVIVDNRPGAGGNVGAELVAKSTPDGYTILNISTAHTISQSLYRKLGYSLERDLTPVVWLGGSSLIMVVTPSLPVKNVAELVAWAKSNRLIYASGGVGVISHLSLEMFKGAARIDATHVPYKGVGPSIPDLISGQVHVMINAIPELFPYAKGGRLRILASLTEKRHPFMPEVPTMIEQGYPDFVLSNWVGIVTSTGTPKPIVNKLAAEVTRVLKLPDVASKLTDQGFDPGGGTPETFGKLIHSEIARFGKAVKASGAQVD
jgi:tripartite-type tricarboxylate transporter receptor subunit TctC